MVGPSLRRVRSQYKWPSPRLCEIADWRKHSGGRVKREDVKAKTPRDTTAVRMALACKRTTDGRVATGTGAGALLRFRRIVLQQFTQSRGTGLVQRGTNRHLYGF